MVRASGGNNEQRHLLIAGYATGIDETCDAMFKIPDDPVNRCALSVHYYTPPTFAILEEDADWGKMRPTWGTDSDFAELKRYMDKTKARAIAYCEIVTTYYNFITKRNIRKNVKVIKWG